MSHGDPYGTGDEVWDLTQPQKACTDAQQLYLRALVERLHSEANWSVLTEYMAKTDINHLNAVRKSLCLPFKPIEGMDTSRGPR